MQRRKIIATGFLLTSIIWPHISFASDGLKNDTAPSVTKKSFLNDLYLGAVSGRSDWDVETVKNEEATNILLLGYNLNSYLAVELSYHDFGHVSDDMRQNFGGPFQAYYNSQLTTLTQGYVTTVDMDVNSLSITGKIRWPVTPRFAAYLQLGGEELRTDYEFTGAYFVAMGSQIVSTNVYSTYRNSDKGLGYFYGLGCHYRVLDHISLVLDYSIRKRTDDFNVSATDIKVDITTLSAGLLFQL